MNLTPITQILMLAAVLLAAVWQNSWATGVLLGLALFNEIIRASLAMQTRAEARAPLLPPQDTGLPTHVPNRVPPAFPDEDEQ